MNHSALNDVLQGMDLSLFDQLLKGRLITGSKILDAGFGGGRNSLYFIDNGFDVYGVDQNEGAVDAIRDLVKNKAQADHFTVGKLENLPYENDSFDSIICNAVLHFAASLDHFHTMFAELVRVLKTGGILFIRMTSDIGIVDKLDSGNNGVHLLPDDSYRFLLKRSMLANVMSKHSLQFIEPLKTVNVNDVRCMSTLVLTK